MFIFSLYKKKFTGAVKGKTYLVFTHHKTRCIQVEKLHVVLNVVTTKVKFYLQKKGSGGEKAKACQTGFQQYIVKGTCRDKFAPFSHI